MPWYPTGRAALVAALLAASASLAMAAGPYPVNMCVGTRNGNLGCAANDVAIAQVQVTNGVTSCVAGTTVNVGLRVVLQSNASSRYDLGVFIARDGKPPELTVPSGGSADCAVFGVPTGPAPLANLNGNVCGDLNSSATPATVDLGVVSVLCVPDQNGNLKLPATITWEQNANGTCNAPPAAWVEAGSPSKCNASEGIDVPIDVVGTLTIAKQTLPAATPGSFAFTATGAAPAAFNLAHGQQQVLTTGPLGATPISVTVTEALLAGFDPTVDLACTTVDGGAAAVVSDPVNRTVTVPLDASRSRVTCTFTNKAASEIRVVKTAVGGDDVFPFVGSQADFSIATVGGAGIQVFPGLSAGRYTVTEVVPAGWDLTAIACVDPSGGTTTSVPGKVAAIDLAIGEIVTCTFTNAREAPATGTINIVKTTTGGNGSFAFSTVGAGLSSFSLTTTGGTSPTKSFTGIAPGAYSVTEQVPAGWALDSISCVDPTGNSSGAGSTASINVAANETVTCTFNNRVPASVVIEKVTQGGDGTFNFTGTAVFAITTVSGFGRDDTTFASVPGGSTVSFAETVPAGWLFAGAACRDALTNAAVGSAIPNGRTVTVAAGQQVICTVTNRRLAQLTIVEVSSPKALQAFAYTATGPGLANFSLFDNGGATNTQVFANLVPGQAYAVTQAAVAGWVTPLILCSDRNAILPANRSTVDLATRTVTPSLQDGEQLTCVFVNQQVVAGSIGITKVTEGGDDSFGFANSGGVGGSPTNPDAFTIATVSSTGSRSLTGLAPGTYTVTETVPAGWISPPTVQCSVIAGSSTTITPVASGATIALGQTGLSVDSVSCTFGNNRAGRITIVEDPIPNAAQVFAYAAQGTGVPANFTLVNDGTPPPADRTAFAPLSAGDYRFTVAAAAGWRLVSIGCVGNAGAVVTLPSRQVDVTVAPGDDVTCTFRHAQESTLSVTKAAPAATAGDTFAFQGPAGLAGNYAAGETRTIQVLAGPHVVTEVVPDGWSLAGIACAGGTVTYTGATIAPTNAFEAGDTTANVLLAAGEASACTFTNNPSSATIVVRKNSVGGTGVFAFTGVEDFQIDTRSLAIHEHQIVVPAGTHAVQEIVPAGWRLTGLTCTGASVVNLATATATVTVGAGERVRCEFTDEKLGRITVVKALRGESTTAFTFAVPPALLPIGIFTLTPPVGGTASRIFEDVPTGDYLITENGPPNGFRPISIDCVDPTGNTATSAPDISAFVRLAPGEHVTCTWTNATLGTITVNAVSFFAQGNFAFTGTNFPTGLNVSIATSPLVGEVNFGNASQQNLPPALYTITPQTPPPGWNFLYAQCATSSGEQHWSITAGVTTIALPDGETVRCFYFYAPLAAAAQPQEIPTLSEGMLWLLVLLMAAAGTTFARPARS